MFIGLFKVILESKSGLSIPEFSGSLCSENEKFTFNGLERVLKFTL